MYPHWKSTGPLCSQTLGSSPRGKQWNARFAWQGTTWHFIQSVSVCNPWIVQSHAPDLPLCLRFPLSFLTNEVPQCFECFCCIQCFNGCDPSDHLQESPGPPGPKSQKSLKKSLFGGPQKSPRKYPKKSKNTPKSPILGIF